MGTRFTPYNERGDAGKELNRNLNGNVTRNKIIVKKKEKKQEENR
jgi:hypothetical protein